MVALDLLPTPAEMVRYLDRHVEGQDRAKRDLATAVYQHYLGLACRDLPGAGGSDFGRQHVLMLGPTGCGKTHLVSILAAWLGVPVAFTAATSLVETGYVGDSVEAPFQSLLIATGGDERRAERGIVYLDEIDKIRRQDSTTRDISGEGVQNGLLTLLDGRPVAVRGRERRFTLDTSRTLYVCTGAFVGLEEVVRNRLARKAPLGFGSASVARRSHIADPLAAVTTDDLVAYGFLPELVGRFSTVTSLRALTTEQLVRILSAVEGAILPRQQRQFELHGVRLEVTWDAQTAIAERAIALGTGARGLARLLRESLAEVAWQIGELSAEGVGTVVVDRDVVEGRARPQLLPEERRDPARARDAARALRASAIGGRAARPTAATTPKRRPASASAEPVVGVARLRPIGTAEPNSKDTTPWTPERLRARLEFLKRALDWDHLREFTRERWRQLEREHASTPATLIQALEGLWQRRAGIEPFLAALDQASTDHLPAVLHYLDYLTERERHERESGGPHRRTPRVPEGSGGTGASSRPEAAGTTLSLGI